MSKTKAVASQSIYVVEDEITLSTLLKMKLKDDYPETKIFSDGAEAYSAIEEKNPDLIILDVMLPGMSGFEILKKVKEPSAGHQPKVLMLTAKHTDEDVEQAFELGVDDYMYKPFNLKELMMRVEKLLN